MANAYGINMANVLNTKDKIKMNKLKRDKMEKDIAVQEAGEVNMYNRLKKENPNASDEELKSMSLNTDLYKYDRERKDKKEDRAAEHSNALSRQNNSFNNSKKLEDYKTTKKREALERETNRRLKIIKANNPDMPDDVATAYAGEQTKDIAKVQEAIQDAKSIQELDEYTRMLNNDGRTLHTIASIKDQAAQAQAWTTYRNKRLKAIQDPKVLQEAMKKLPENYDPNWTALTIASSSDLMKDAKEAKDYLKKTEAEMKAEAGDGVGTATYAQQTAKVNAISKKVDSYFKDMDEPKLAQKVKALVVEKWKKQGRKQNEDSIILEVIDEIEQNELANTPEEKSTLQKLKSAVGMGDNETKKAPKNKKNGNILGKATKPEGTRGTYKGKSIEVIDGQWVYL